ncbi:hypothetical protein PUR36_32385, partial [Klebsiella pneumoniae]|uniref:hypothetical protein n=1 Tax=Klebsiella pneumoniae TaxID=573 RepID=UPI0023F649C2
GSCFFANDNFVRHRAVARYPQKIGLWGVRGAEEYCYRLYFAPALLSVRREGAIGWKPDIIPLSNLLRCYAKFA